jgi:hypothetical protein
VSAPTILPAGDRPEALDEATGSGDGSNGRDELHVDDRRVAFLYQIQRLGLQK